jgi:TRAP transporter 4TM/12TM fusion protein
MWTTPRASLVYLAGLGFALFQLIVPPWAGLFDMQLRALHVMAAVLVTLLAAPFLRGSTGWRGLAPDLALIVPLVVANLIIVLHWQDILTYRRRPDILDLALGGLLILVVLEAARRSTGWAIPAIVVLTFGYVFAGAHMPGRWSHPGFPLSYVLESLYYSTTGIYGSLTGSSATFIMMFILFGALLKTSGGGQTFMDLALLAAGRFRGGPAKVGVVSSALFGMMSGSSVANVAVTGNYTIPMMTRLGYNRNFAGGVEAMASAGGGVTPPIMGLAAFIMADFLNVPYSSIILYAAIPAALFYVSLLAGVHFEACRKGLSPIPADELPRARDVLTWRRLAPVILPVVVLLYLLFTGYSLTRAGFYACLTVVVLFLLADLSPRGMLERARKLVDGLAEGGASAAKIAPILISIAIFASLLGMTGVAPKVSGVIIALGGDNVLGALAVAAIVPLVLGAPLPVSATYILSAALIAPALVRIDLDPIAVHLFLIYWAILGAVTPPTCTACVIAANISGGNWLKTSFVGMRLGIVAFIVPFAFVVNPALIGRAEPLEIAVSGLTALAGVVFLAAGFAGYMLDRIGNISRALHLIAGALLFMPDPDYSIPGGILAAGLLGFAYLRGRTKAPAQAPNADDRVAPTGPDQPQE